VRGPILQIPFRRPGLRTLRFVPGEFELNQGMNVVVGDNDVGKSNLLEAFNLALTDRLNGVSIATELSDYWLR
jgi:AAA15 family ATPase/GTPase